ncbi:MAG: Uma2 family endonuclease, partial [Rubrivivax sp.]
MGYAARKPAMGPDAYLAWEAGQPTRSELVDGEVFAMAGAEERHVTVAGNAYMALRQALAGTPCRTFLTDMKLRPLGADD